MEQREVLKVHALSVLSCVLFGNQVFSIRWHGLRIMKYKMDSRPQIVDLFERYTCKYMGKP